MTYPQTTPHVDPAQLRPGRVWYWVAGLIVVLGVCLGPGLAVLGFASIAGDLPEMKQEFDAGTSATVELSADTDWAIYVDNPDAFSDGSEPAVRPDVECTGEGAGIDVSESTTSFDFDGGQRYWQLVYDVSVSRDGSYRITCDSNDPELTEPLFAVGTGVDVGGVIGKVFGSLGALLGIPCVALLIAGVIALVAGLRRSSHKKRLLEQGGHPFAGYPPQPGPVAPAGYPAQPGYPAAEPGYPPPPTSAPPYGSPTSGPPYPPPTSGPPAPGSPYGPPG